MTDGLLAVWLHPADADVGVMARAALDMTEVPDLQARFIASTGDTITLQLVDGRAPLGHELLYVQGRGAYELVRVERWPAGQVLLGLAAWPRR